MITEFRVDDFEWNGPRPEQVLEDPRTPKSLIAPVRGWELPEYRRRFESRKRLKATILAQFSHDGSGSEYAFRSDGLIYRHDILSCACVGPWFRVNAFLQGQDAMLEAYCEHLYRAGVRDAKTITSKRRRVCKKHANTCL